MSEPMKYRKKPVTIEAMRYDSVQTLRDLMEWSGGRFINVVGDERDPDDPNRFLRTRVLAIQTLEGDMIVNVGDYVIRGVQGEFYPCKPDIFAATYEAVTGDE